MTKTEARAFLISVRPFAAKGEDFCTTFNGEAVSGSEELFRILEEEYGELVLDAFDPVTKDSCYVTVVMDSCTEYKCAAPTGLSLKVMEAVWLSFDI